MEKIHNEELNDLYSSPNIGRVVKARRMRWAEHVALMGDRRDVYSVLVGKTEGKRPLGRKDLDGRIILKWSFRKSDVTTGTGLIWLKIGTGDRLL